MEVFFAQHSIAIFGKAPASDASGTRVKIKLPDEGDSEVASWGDDNLYPQKILEEIRKNGPAGSGLAKLHAAHFGEGLKLMKEEATEQGKRQKIFVDIKKDYPEIYRFFKENRIQHFFSEVIWDLEFFNIAFPEFVLSKDRKKIVRVKRQKAAWSRFEIMDEKLRFSKNVYVRNDWSESALDDGYTSKIPVIPNDWPIEEVRKYITKKKLTNFVMPFSYVTMDEAYYPHPFWHSVYKNGWIDVSNSIPKLKKAIFNNQLHFKYVIYVSDEYYERYYGDDWHEFTLDKKEQIRKQLVESIDKHLSGNDAGGRSLIAPKFKDSNGDWVKGIEVEPIDNKLKDGNYLPDASAANSEILFALGVDPTLIGAGIPGGKLGAGSGSDKREAYNLLMAFMHNRRVPTVELWNFIRDFNGWPDELEATFPNKVLTTLDKNPTGSANVL